jgi:hypothetical protein
MSVNSSNLSDLAEDPNFNGHQIPSGVIAFLVDDEGKLIEFSGKGLIFRSSHDEAFYVQSQPIGICENDIRFNESIALMKMSFRKLTPYMYQCVLLFLANGMKP